ncbi:4Fe-4S binding protein [Oceanirhabdus seepicola]|uniref:4Fe-4S ferredoxin-type domain-containing protein n=1 Tax=Oceanirhabdus seepicola TaxID=2828781 RepID=A0A9J6NUT7_9CLOT|nr:4Fe-4S dicluster domain-containing protein [Oceanirhabdus seepicola]MCM1988247.1 hypothetical protein [Oceanirhabdus seepicola]
MKTKEKSKNSLLKLLKVIVVIFIITGFVIGGMNGALGKSENVQLAHIVRTIYLMYENIFRTVIIIISSYITFKLLKNRNKGSKMRFVSLITFSSFMLIIFVIMPLITGIADVAIAVMPFSWSSMPIQLLKDGHFFSSSIQSHTVNILLIMYVVYQGVVLLGTLIYGRRFHCSMICPYAGGHAESFSLALPLIKKKNSRSGFSNLTLKLLNILKVFMILFAFGIMGLMAIDVFGGIEVVSFETLRQMEMIKYMTFDIILMQLAYVTLNGRGYCYYCPAGTILGLVSKLSGQRIETDLTECINCGLCDRECDMSICISEKALKGEALSHINCVGCGHCVDICPKDNLKYSTSITRKIYAKKETTTDCSCN